jgi:hypothetical protein
MEPIPLNVSGRGKLTAAAHVDADGVRIRLEDDRNSAFWAEVWLTAEDLARLWEQVRQQQPDTQG